MGRYDRTDLGAYSLGLLETAEAARVERHLAACQDCRQEVREFEAVRSMLDHLAEVKST
ncbi:MULTISPECIES: zf-HC2 domain-containing protein [unclassified Amycolatopsis]|uniref:zf-HC2 domain-containing protein n=1 Tax=unclassified Amycolatopsis TaxID=2618356 RepID=UPI001FF50EEE|nr:zf-HC2 domain-containing protein [Amycolatopsis sp. FBCC-B4732]UOX88469.1 zf-HC2 domain-containing protein [Amycolatopsis sp. FBCC-B4732]